MIFSSKFQQDIFKKLYVFIKIIYEKEEQAGEGTFPTNYSCL